MIFFYFNSPTEEKGLVMTKKIIFESPILQLEVTVVHSVDIVIK